MITTRPIKLIERLVYFVGIGSLAALVHLTVVVYLVSALELQPLIANVIAFLIAFQFSFFGHKYLTFARLEEQKTLQLPHFFLVAATGGIINECLYFLLLHYTRLDYFLSLVLVLGLSASYNFVISRYFACR
jgi:putative flippase GtrA